MMFMPGPFELLLLLLIGGLIVAVLSRLIGGGSGESSAPKAEGFTLGHTTLTCPHCGQETKAGVPTCQQCGSDL